MQTPTYETEFTCQFKKYFENPSPDLEKRKVTFIPPAGSGAIINAFNHTESVGSSLLIDINPVHDSTLYNEIENDFLNHTRDRKDYNVESIRVLRNIKMWKRYHAEKQIQRDSAQEERNSRNQARAAASQSSQPTQPTYPIEEEDPEKLFSDEVLYHGTLADRVPSILLNGLDPKLTIRANYGKGVYFSDSIEKCMQYVDRQEELNQTYSVILCCVLLGKVLVEPHTRSNRHLGQSSTFLPEGYNSAVAHDLFREWIVFEKPQILPLCVINFKTTNKASSTIRLTSYHTLLRGTDTYPSHMNEIQRYCTVSVPKDASTYEAISKYMEWRASDEEVDNMLNKAFSIPNGQTKLCNIYNGTTKDWVVMSVPTGHMCVISEKNMTALLSLSKNVQTLTSRLDQQRRRTALEREHQRRRIEKEIQSIPDGQKLVAILDELEQEMKSIEMEGEKVIDQINQLKLRLTQSGQEAMINTHEFHLAIHPLKTQFDELKAQYNEKQKSFAAWNQEHINLARQIRTNLRQLSVLVTNDSDSENRQQESIKTELTNINKLALSSIIHITEEELKKRRDNAKEAQERPGFWDDKKKLKMETVKVDLSTVQIWPQLVAEILMSGVMIKQLKYEHACILDNTNSTNRIPRIRDSGVRDVSESWHVAPMSIFGAPAACSYFWPIEPRHRLPNREFIHFKDYLIWMITERVIRARKQHQLQNQHRYQHSNFMPPVPMQHIQDQLDRLDPTILQAIQGQSSRFGTVVFNRQERQKELEKMGADILNELYVEVQHHMLEQEGAECPICQESLVVPGHDRANSSAQGSDTLNPEKVVKLKSCRHCFHEDCISSWFSSKDSQLKCPMCNTMCTTNAKSGATKKAMTGGPMKLGPMPDGVMGYSFDARLSCYFIYIVIPAHTIPNSDPSVNQGQNISVNTDIRYAIVPFSARLGPLLMIRLISAFYYGHLFRNGQSITRGVNNVVVWNGIHLRTAMTGEYGFPAPNFETNCWEEISQKGVSMGLEELVINMPSPDGTPVTRYDTNVQQTEGVNLPAEVLEELAAQEMITKMFHPLEPLLFGATS
ncbi:putative E3 ubiquitin-protein ligase dtx2 [Entomortierella beljakovae]|nr:putative E3 ubiquitin-protein ligase dtx2 [Entomortierella beljakovae]